MNRTRALPRFTPVSAVLTAVGTLLLPLFAPSPALRAQTASPQTPQEEVVQMSPFNVSATNADRYLSDEAISAVRVRAPLLDTPSSISVVTRGMMDDLSPTRVFDATRYIAGVQEGRGIQFQDRMIIRGFETQGGARTVDNFLQSADADEGNSQFKMRLRVFRFQPQHLLVALDRAPGLPSF